MSSPVPVTSRPRSRRRISAVLRRCWRPAAADDGPRRSTPWFQPVSSASSRRRHLQSSVTADRSRSVCLPTRSTCTCRTPLRLHCRVWSKVSLCLSLFLSLYLYICTPCTISIIIISEGQTVRPNLWQLRIHEKAIARCRDNVIFVVKITIVPIS